jgi:anti-anti-sigma factor
VIRVDGGAVTIRSERVTIAAGTVSVTRDRVCLSLSFSPQGHGCDGLSHEEVAMHEHVPTGASAPTELPRVIPGGQPLRVGVTLAEGAIVVTITGELDLAVAEAVHAQVREAWELHQRPMVLDLNGVTFMDSAGLRSLLTVMRDLGRQGAAPTIAGVSHAVRRVLELSGTTGLIRPA